MPHTHLATSRQRGLSLIEFTVALSISVIVIGTAVPSFQRMLAQRRLEGRAAELQTDLHYARTEAVSRHQRVQISFQTSGTGACYVLNTGSNSTDCTCRDAAPTVCINGAKEIKTVNFPVDGGMSLQANVPVIAFDPVRGTATSFGSIAISIPDGQAIKHIVNRMGRVRACAPAARIASIKPC